MVRPAVGPSVAASEGGPLGSEPPPASRSPLPGGSRLQADIGHRFPHGQQNLDIGELRGHGCGTGLVAVLHRDLSEGRPTLPVGAQLQRHGLGTGAGELGGTRTGKRMWLELPCPATPHTIQPRCPCHATHHSNGLILHCLDTQGAPDTPRELFVDERLYYMTCPAEGSRVPHSNIVGDRPWENAPSNLHNAAVCPSRVLTPLHCPPCLPPTAHSALTALTSESCLLTLPPPTTVYARSAPPHPPGPPGPAGVLPCSRRQLDSALPGAAESQSESPC